MARSFAEIEVTSPCTESWGSMQGNAARRFCASCEKHVHNLAAMTPREVERLVIRAAAGDAVCARVTRKQNGDLVTLTPARSPQRAVFAGAALSATMAVALPVAAQNAQSNPENTAVLTGRVIGYRIPMGMIFLQEQGRTRFGKLSGDGSFEISAPPGVYDVHVPGSDFTAKAVTLHEGVQSMNDIHAGPEMIMTTSGEITARSSMGYWVRHPLSYVRYLGYKVRKSFRG